MAVEVKTDDYSVLTTDSGKTLCLDAATDKTFTLPSVGAGDVGAYYTFVVLGAGRLTVQTADSDVVLDSAGGGAVYSDEQYASLSVTLTQETRWTCDGGFGTWVAGSVWWFGLSHVPPKTGQTTSYRTGDDGDLEAGRSLADRWLDNGDNTVTDLVTGLTWVAEPSKIVPGGTGTATAGGHWNPSAGAISAGEIWDLDYPEWVYGTGYSLGDRIDNSANNPGEVLEANTDHPATFRVPGEAESVGTWALVTAWQYDVVVGAGAERSNYGTVYVCDVPHTTSYDDEPGVGASWETYWHSVTTTTWDYYVTFATADLFCEYGGNCYKSLEGTDSDDYDPSTSPNYTSVWDTVTPPDTWADSTGYTAGQVRLDQYTYTRYTCRQNHTSSYDDEPGVGVNWETYWEVTPLVYVCTSGHTAAADKEPPNASYWVATPWADDGTDATSEAAQTWADAVDNALALDYAGFTDWRLPNVNELLSLVDWSKPSGRFFNSTYFPNATSTYTVCSTTSGQWGASYTLAFTQPNGDVVARAKTNAEFHVYPVRGGKL